MVLVLFPFSFSVLLLVAFFSSTIRLLTTSPFLLSCSPAPSAEFELDLDALPGASESVALPLRPRADEGFEEVVRRRSGGGGMSLLPRLHFRIIAEAGQTTDAG